MMNKTFMNEYVENRLILFIRCREIEMVSQENSSYLTFFLHSTD